MITNVLKQIENRTITDVIAGNNTGSIIILCFDQDFSLTIKCTWRLENNEKILTGWNESNNSDTGALALNIRKLIGNKIKRIEIEKFYDLKIRTDNDFSLNVFCDITPNIGDEYLDENWTIADIKNDKAFTINKFFEVKEERYS